MVIQWYGQACFKITSGELTIAIDPFDKQIGLTPPRFKSDLLLVTHSHPDHANIETIQGEPFLINGPGEYDVKGVNIRGIESFHDKQKGKERGLNSIYIIELEDITVCHLGDFGEGKLRSELREQISQVDILMVPVGGIYTIDAEEAAEVVSELEPKLVIPMHYHVQGLKLKLDPVEKFLEEMGAKKVEAEEKITIKKKGLEEGKTKIVVLKASSEKE